jgi:hypothetical protein
VHLLHLLRAFTGDFTSIYYVVILLILRAFMHVLRDFTLSPDHVLSHIRPPSTNAPSTNAPSTNAPSTNAPSTNAPSTNAPSTNARKIHLSTNYTVRRCNHYLKNT